MNLDEHPRALIQNIGDVELPYLEYEGHGETVLLLHATGFLPWLWHPIARTLSGSCRVIAPYFCDHRRADPEKGGLNWMVLARDLKIFCDRLALEAPVLVGHSMGGTVITIAAGIFGLKPKGIVLIEPIFLPEDFYRTQIRVDDHPLASKSIRRRDHWDNADEARAYLRARELFKNWDEEILDLYIRFGLKAEDTGGLRLACSPAREAALFMGGMRYDPWPILPAVQCPVLIVEGGESENRQFIDLKKALTLFARGSYRLIEGAGHLIPMERPRETTEIITAFCRQIQG